MESSKVAVDDLIDFDETTDLPIIPNRRKPSVGLRKSVGLSEDTLQILDLNNLDFTLDPLPAIVSSSSRISSGSVNNSNNEKGLKELSLQYDLSSINELDMAFVGSKLEESSDVSSKHDSVIKVSDSPTDVKPTKEEDDEANCSSSSDSSTNSQVKPVEFSKIDDEIKELIEFEAIEREIIENLNKNLIEISTCENLMNANDNNENCVPGEAEEQVELSDEAVYGAENDVFVSDEQENSEEGQESEVKLLDITNFTFPSPLPPEARNKSFGNSSINLMDMSISKFATAGSTKSFGKFSTPKSCLKLSNNSTDEEVIISNQSRRTSKSVSFQSPGLYFAAGKRLSNIRKTPIRRSLSSNVGIKIKTPDSMINNKLITKFSTPNNIMSTPVLSPFSTMVKKFSTLALVTPPSIKFVEPSRPVTNDIFSINTMPDLSSSTEDKIDVAPIQ